MLISFPNPQYFYQSAGYYLCPSSHCNCGVKVWLGDLCCDGECGAYESCTGTDWSQESSSLQSNPEPQPDNCLDLSSLGECQDNTNLLDMFYTYHIYFCIFLLPSGRKIEKCHFEVWAQFIMKMWGASGLILFVSFCSEVFLWCGNGRGLQVWAEERFQVLLH